MSTDLERVSLGSSTAAAAAAVVVNSGAGPQGSSGGSGGSGRALSANVRKLHNALNSLLCDAEREQFIHCLNVYHAKRNVCDLVHTLRVILDTAGKRQLLPMLRLVIPRSDQLLFDQYTSEGLYLLKADHLLLPAPTNCAGGGGGGATESFGDVMMMGNANHQGWTISPHDPHHHHHHHLLHQQQQPLSYSTWPEAGFSSSNSMVDGSVVGTVAGLAPPPLAPLMPWFGLGGAAGGEMRRVTLTRSRSHEGLGFSIRGGCEHGVGIYVSLVEPGSSAQREGLRVGDQIAAVNDTPFDGVTHIEAVKVLKGCKRLSMSVCSVGRVPGGHMANHVYSWVDPRGRSVSPPPDMTDGTGRFHDMDERTVILNMDDGRSLGLMIRGGAEYGLGIYITGVDPGSAADVGALKVGDQIVEVNGCSFVTISHDEAVHILKTGSQLSVRVRAVGRLPHARTALEPETQQWVNNGPRTLHHGDETQWVSDSPRHAPRTLHHGDETLQWVSDSPPTVERMAAATATAVCNSACGSANASACSTRPSSARATPVLGKPASERLRMLSDDLFSVISPYQDHAMEPPLTCGGVGPPGGQVFLEDQAYLLLTEPERQTLVYYLQEYHEGHIGVEPLTMALFELFNTHAKLSLVSEVRSLVAPQDLELYDGLVLHRDREAHKVWQHQGGVPPHPQSHCIHQAATGHNSPSKNDISAGCRIGEDLEESTNALRNVTVEEVQCSCEHPPQARPSSSVREGQARASSSVREGQARPSSSVREGQARPSSSVREGQARASSSVREGQARRLHSARPGGQPSSGMSFTGPTRLFQDCLHRPVKPLLHQASPNSAHHVCPNAARHPSLSSLRHTCQSSPYLPTSSDHHHQQQQQQQQPQPHPAHHHHHNQHLFLHNDRPSATGRHHTCSGFLHHGGETASPNPKPEASSSSSIKLSSRASSYDKSSSVQARSSAASSNSATPVASPHPSPCPSPCPSLVVPPPPPCSPKQPCSPSPPSHRDGNRLTADGRTQQRGATLSQLSDSGQTLSEDSGVDIAEAGGLSKDGSPRPSKGHGGQPEPPPGAQVAPQTSRQTGSPGPAPSTALVRVAKNANTLGIAIEGGANTRQPLPRIVTIQAGGSAHRCGQLKVGQVILEVNGVSLRGREHKDAARVIAEAFKTKEKDHIDFLVAEVNHAHLPGH